MTRLAAPWLLLIFAIAVALIAAFIWGPPTSRPMLVFAAAVLAAAAGLANAANSLDTRSSQAAQARIGVALAFIDEWNAPALYQCKKCGRDVISFFEKDHRIEAQDAYL
ncbi:MAG TPA: hypothetical protein VFS05_06235, partial [Gemmatimonadaceae bacterium]|nr:hypothetical protein [Gemmatimonadaceae bacterium]